jgi:hypothetical protein
MVVVTVFVVLHFIVEFEDSLSAVVPVLRKGYNGSIAGDADEAELEVAEVGEDEGAVEVGELIALEVCGAGHGGQQFVVFGVNALFVYLHLIIIMVCKSYYMLSCHEREFRE